jgi:hypothetical protein
MNKTGQFTNWIKRIIAYNYFPIIVLIAINIIIGALIFKDYGESWDENLRFTYAERSLAAYSGAEKDLSTEKGQFNEKGAFYVMLAKLGSDAMRAIDDRLQPIEAWHFIHFLSFLLGVFFLYKLCLKFTGKRGAFFTALLFNTQPVLWGHAFINPKDIPFMAFFIGSVALGMDMVDNFNHSFKQTTPPVTRPLTEVKTALRKDWARAPRRRQIIIVALVGSTVGILIVLVLFAGSIREFYSALIRYAYNPSATNLLSNLFSQLAKNHLTIPVDHYIQKVNTLYFRFVWLYFRLLLGFLVFLAVLQFPSGFLVTWRVMLKPFIIQIGHSLVNLHVAAAGIILGMCTSIRILGPASGLLVGLYFILKSKWKAVPVLLGYSGIAMLVTYLTWPYLWGAPIQNLLRSIEIASDFPWGGKVLFAGIEYTPASLPRSYLPVLLIIQTPEFSLILFLSGLMIVTLGIFSKKLDWQKWLVISLWFFLPLLAVIIVRPTIYDNFRQFLFILPPAFLFIAASLQWILDHVHNKLLTTIIMIALVLPNIFTLVKLHPFQYSYYNNLVGGLQGAFRRYDTDYWATSYAEATRYLNKTAPTGSTVVVVGPSQIVEHYARKDLNIKDLDTMIFSGRSPVGITEPYYAVILSRHNNDQTLFPEAPEVFSVGREGATFTVVKLVNP